MCVSHSSQPASQPAPFSPLSLSTTIFRVSTEEEEGTRHPQEGWGRNRGTFHTHMLSVIPSLSLSLVLFCILFSRKGPPPPEAPSPTRLKGHLSVLSEFPFLFMSLTRRLLCKNERFETTPRLTIPLFLKARQTLCFSFLLRHLFVATNVNRLRNNIKRNQQNRCRDLIRDRVSV